MSPIQNFRRHLEKKEIYYEDVPFEGGGHGFRLQQTLDNGPRLILGVSFNKEENLVDIKIYNIAKINNPLKKEFLYSLLNELNNDYRFTKFVEENEEVTASYSFHLNDTLDQSEFIFDKLIMVYNCIEKEFPKFMKLQWS